MANVMVYVEVRGGVSTPASRFAVGEARRVASELGATVYALVPLGPAGQDGIEALAAAVGEAGADRILCCCDPALEGPPLDARVGVWVASVAERLRPLLTLLPSGGIGAELGPPLAARTGAAFAPRAALEIVQGARASEAGEQPRPRLLLRRRRPSDGSHRVLDARELERPLVATLHVGSARPAPGQAAVEVEMLSYVGGPPCDLRELECAPDPAAEIDQASGVILVPRGTPQQVIESLRAVAPGGTAVAAADDATLLSLETACPSRLLVIADAAPEALPAAPHTRVALVSDASDATKALGVDTVWRASGAGAVAGVVQALARRGRAKEMR